MVIVDGGIASAENLALLRAEGFDYLVNDSRRRRGRYAQEFSEEETFNVIADRQKRQPVRVRLLQEKHEVVDGDTGNDDTCGYHEQVVLCKSDARGLKYTGYVRTKFRSCVQTRDVDKINRDRSLNF